MYIFAYSLQLLALLCALSGAGLAVVQVWQGRSDALKIIEKSQYMLTAALTVASALLLHALFWNDFSLVYVASYTDRILPVFYRLTAFWAGQAGSMLFWAFSVALCGVFFMLTPAYRKLSDATKLWYWIFFSSIMAFFSLILACWSNPFLLQTPVPADGNGLNPLLQNPGMIFHPPLLFLGYGGFVIPGCLALAQSLSGNRDVEGSWIQVARPFTLLAWLFLTAGIVLGAWWAYMELGWGGYWAWDPVENASLIPWLVGTAAIHTMIVEDRRGKLGRVNVFLMALTTVSAFFATYLVRSGVIDSVHAFGSGSVGMPLLIFILASTLLSFWIALMGKSRGKPLAGIDSREGFLVLVAWVLLMLSLIIWVATLWPLISKIWTVQAQGLDAGFYNRVCLPLAAMLTVILAICPWLGWGGGVRDKKGAAVVVGVFVGAGALFWFMGYRHPTAFIASAAAVAAIASFVMLMLDAKVRAVPNAVAAYGVHLGVALLVLGVAFSGPYKQEGDLLLAKGDKGRVGGYEITLVDIVDGVKPGFDYIEGRLEIRKDNVLVGVLAPQRRIYDKFGNQQFSEVDTVASLGAELYASLLGLDTQHRLTVKFSVHPLVNWMWIGGTLMCLFPLFGLRRRKSKQEVDA
ncbi:MAG: cytochrome c biogenesis protein CcsA [Desulfovibrionaceae bacterium]